MKNREQMALVVVAVIGIVAVAAILFLWDFSPAEEEKEGIGRAGSAESGSSIDGTAEAAEGDEKNRSREKIASSPAGKDGSAGAGAGSAEPGDGSLHGRVVAENGIGLQGARISFTKESELRFPRPGFQAKIRTETDRDGRFSLGELPDTTGACLLVDHDDFVKHRILLGDFSGGSLDLGTIVLDLGGSVTGFVRTKDGEIPVEGAEVSVVNIENSVHSDGGAIVITGGSSIVKERTAATDREGYFRVRGVEPGRCRLSVSHDSYPSCSGSELVVEKGRDTASPPVLLKRGYIISGFIRDEDGNPLEGIYVSAGRNKSMNVIEIGSGFRFFTPRESRTGKDGSFLIEGLDEGVFELTASGGVWFPESHSGVEAGEEGVTFVLRKGGSVFGRLTDSKTGDPLDGFDLRVNRARFGIAFNGTIYRGRDAADRIGTGVDPRGAYLVEGVDSEGIDLRFSADGYAETRISNIAAAPGEKRETDAALNPEARISGTVLDPSGDPVAEATVLLEPLVKDPALPPGVRKRMIRNSDENDGIPEITSGLTVRKTQRSVTGRDGKFDLRGVPEGDYELKAVHQIYVESPPREIVGLESGDRKEDLKLTLRAGGGIEGTVYGKDGKPASGMKVRAVALFGEGLEEVVTSNVDGKYAFKGLEPGFYSVLLKKGHDESSSFMMVFSGSEPVDPGGIRVAVEEGDVATVDLRDLPEGSVAGYVREAGKGAAGVEVQLHKPDGMSFMALKTVHTDEDGRYLMDGIGPGDYNVRLGIAGVPDDFEQDVTVSPASRVERDFELPSGRITGRVTETGTGLPVKGVRISLENYVKEKPQERRQVRMMSITMTSSGSGPGNLNTIFMDGSGKEIFTDDEGRYEIRFLKEGVYRLTASGAGFLKGKLEPVEVREGKETSGRNLSLARGATIEGRTMSRENGSPVPAIMIRYERLDGGDGDAGDGSMPPMTVSDASGRFKIEGLEAGRYRLDASGIIDMGTGTEAHTGSIEVSVRRGETEEVELEVVTSPR